MMKPKRLVPALVALALTAALVTACGGASKAPAAPTPAPTPAPAAPAPAPAAPAAPKNPFDEAEVGKKFVVGKGTVGDMNVVYFMEDPKPDMVHPSNHHGITDGTHHFEVKVFDKNPPHDPVSYVNVTGIMVHQQSKKELKVDVVPMLGSWFHYGDDVKLPEKGKWDVTLKVEGPDLMRYATTAKKFTGKGELNFTFEYK